METVWNNLPAWISAIAATIAAFASVAVWVRGRGAVDIRVRSAGRSKVEIVNAGTKPAKKVHVRVGSESDASDVEDEKSVELLAPGEPLPILAAPDNSSARDIAVNVSWRGWFGRRGSFVYRLLA